MVTRSDHDYEQHKAEIHEIIRQKYGNQRADKFLDFYCDRYDEHGRSFIHWKLALWLMDDYYHVRNVGTKWYAFVGVGGTGKSTLMQNVLYFLDKKFTLQSAPTSITGFLKQLSTFPSIDSHRSIGLDEPDDEHNPNSKIGKLLRKVLGKCRQQRLFLSICATDLKDIPGYWFRKLDGIFFCPVRGRYMFFKNRPRHGEYIVQEIRRKYNDYGYHIFFMLKKKIGCLAGPTLKHSPLAITQGDKYLETKREDYEDDLKTALKAVTAKEQKPKIIDKRAEIISSMREQGLTNVQIGKYMGITPGRVSQIAKEHG